MSAELNSNSGVRVTTVRVAEFRSLKNVEVELDDLSVLIGSNNSGKSSFIDAFHAAIGAGRKTLGTDDIRVGATEAFAPKERAVTIDVRIQPVTSDGSPADTFPSGGYWTALWGLGIAQDATDNLREFVGIRTTLSWNQEAAEYVVKRAFMKEWKPFAEWLSASVQSDWLSSAAFEPIALHYIDAKRDLDDDLRREGTFWRRLTDDLGLTPDQVLELEGSLTAINDKIVSESAILGHLKKTLATLHSVVAAESGVVELAPVARRLRDLAKGVDVTFSASATQSFPLVRHGMGTRSLASLLIFKAFASWRSAQAIKGNRLCHNLVGLEEPEAHLHPQAQRALFAHIQGIPGQRIVSTHSPYFAGQADLKELRLFTKHKGETRVARLDVDTLGTPEDVQRIKQAVVRSRGDLLFAKAIVLVEGQTEELGLPVWARAYWGKSIHELGISFVCVGGSEGYRPFVALAHGLMIPWFVLGDGEPKAVAALNSALTKLGLAEAAGNPNVTVLPDGNDFEAQLVADGYLAEIELALDRVEGEQAYLDGYIARMNGQKTKKGAVRDYSGDDGRARAARDALHGDKLRYAEEVAVQISVVADQARQVPPMVRKLFAVMDPPDTGSVLPSNA